MVSTLQHPPAATAILWESQERRQENDLVRTGREAVTYTSLLFHRPHQLGGNVVYGMFYIAMSAGVSSATYFWRVVELMLT